MALEIIQAFQMLLAQKIYIIFSTLCINQHFLPCYLFLNISQYFKIFVYFSVVWANKHHLHM